MTAVTISTKTALDLIAALNSAENSTNSIENISEARRLTCILAREMKGDLCEQPRAMGGKHDKYHLMRSENACLRSEIAQLGKECKGKDKLLTDGRIAIAKIEGVRKELAKVLLKPSPDSPLGRIAGIIYAN